MEPSTDVEVRRTVKDGQECPSYISHPSFLQDQFPVAGAQKTVGLVTVQNDRLAGTAENLGGIPHFHMRHLRVRHLGVLRFGVDPIPELRSAIDRWFG